MGIVDQYLVQLNSEKRRWRRAAAILAILSLLVATGVSWNLRMTGITIANGSTCGQEEHQHDADCPHESLLICGYEDATAEAPAEAPSETAPAHVHTDACYDVTWLCGIEEHIHVFSCYADATADIESAAIWEATLPALTEDWAEDLVQIAQSQLGNSESADNYILAEDGETRNGITRYGQWYGNPHGDWSAMFTLFCLHYAQIPQETIPWSPGVYNMMRLLQDAQIFLQPDENLAESGNLLFLDTDANGNADRIAILCGYEEAEEGAQEANFIAIAGDWENTVAQITIPETDPGIMGYVNIRQLQKDWIAPEGADSSAPAVYLDVEDRNIVKRRDCVEECISLAASLCQQLLRRGRRVSLAVNALPDGTAPVCLGPDRG
jgi:hypothetical protein